MRDNFQRNADIRIRRQAGEGPREIARAMGLSPSVVAGVLHRAGMATEPKGRGHGLPPSTVRTIRSAIASGVPYSEIARRFGVDPWTPYGIASGKLHRSVT